MKKLILVACIVSVFIWVTWYSKVSYAQTQIQTQNQNIVEVFLVIPSDWRSRITYDTEAKYKQNIQQAMSFVQQFYASKVPGGHTFVYDTNIKTINSGVLKSSDFFCVEGMTKDLSLPQTPYNRVQVFFVVGSGNYSNCALPPNFPGSRHNIGGEAYISHQTLEGLGDPGYKRNSLTYIAHELGHAFDLVYAGWAKAHTCSIVDKTECLEDIPEIKNNQYPPLIESSSLMSPDGGLSRPGGGLDFGFNNSIYNPEIQKLFDSIFINPNKDSSPSLTSNPTTQASIVTSLSPNPVQSGETLRITGRGFGSKASSPFATYLYNGKLISHPVDVQIITWTDSEIDVKVPDLSFDYLTKWDLYIFKEFNEKVIVNEQLNIQPRQVSATPTPAPIPTYFPSPSPSSTSSALPTSTPSPSLTPSPSSTSNSKIKKIKISNYKDFRENPIGDDGTSTQIFGEPLFNITWQKSSLSPNSPIYITPVNPDNTTGDLYEINISNGGVYKLGDFTIQAKVIKKIVKIKFGDKEIASDFTQKIRLHLPGVEGQSGYFSVPVIISYSDGTSKSLFYSFNYNPLGISTPSPSATPITSATPPCTGIGVPSAAHSDNRQEWGGSCTNGVDTGRATAIPGTCSCTVAQCLQYSGGPYCWVNNGQTYNDPVGCAAKGAALASSCFTGSPATPSPTPVLSCVPTVATKCDIDCTLPENCGKATMCDNNCTPITGVRTPGQCNACK